MPSVPARSAAAAAVAVVAAVVAGCPSEGPQQSDGWNTSTNQIQRNKNESANEERAMSMW